jgi:tetratricopeptide (TPR) repeat protein
MKKFFLIVLFAVPAFCRAETAGNPNEQFLQANQLYEKGDFDKAGEIYQGLTGQGFESAELFYNLGNIYYRKGERGKAVLWYERALRLSPREADIQFNLGLARSHIKDEDSGLLRKLFLYFTGDELSVLLALLIWVFFGVLGARTMGWIKSESWPGVALWFTGFLLAFSGAWFGVALAFDRQPVGVVVNPPGEVRNGPGQDYAVGFTIPEGSNVLILNKRPDWTQVGVLNQGLKGWMPNGDVEPIAPNSFSLN